MSGIDEIIARRGDVIELRPGVAVTPDIQPTILSSEAFTSGFRPPDYVLDGVLQRGFLYSLTAPTGAGKTAVGLRLMAHIALGQKIGHREVQRGRVLMCVGENADDVRARWLALSEQMGFLASEIDAHFIPSIFSVVDALPALRAHAERLGGFSLVIVDTSAAYFLGDEENSNKQLGDHARALRALTTLAGNPCVVANCHPPKSAGEDNLLPRGGGAFIAEVDGNLTCSKRDGALEVHWSGKFRGPDFEPMAFELLTIHSDRLIDSRGRHVPTVVAKPLSEGEQATRASLLDAELRRLLTAMAENPGASIAMLAERAGWSVAGGRPHKSKVSRHLNELRKSKLAVKELSSWTLTSAGEKAAKRAA